jgi:hypothetical protein
VPEALECLNWYQYIGMAENESQLTLPSTLTRVSDTFPRSDPVNPDVSPHQTISSSVAFLHRLYPTELLPDEERWRDSYSFLLSHGLELRPRFKPGWTPSWIGTNLDPGTCEDSIEKNVR